MDAMPKHPPIPTCSFCGEDRRGGAAGFCLRHYRQHKAGEALTLERQRRERGAETYSLQAALPVELRTKLERAVEKSGQSLGLWLEDVLRRELSTPRK
jgi:hypothetical protein